jgi:hypothetical protein
MPIEAALFFDNDIEYCIHFSPWANKITPFHIGGYQKAQGEKFPIKPWDEMRQFRAGLTQEGKLVFDQLRFLTAVFPPEGQGDSYDETSGITFPQAQIILNALERKTQIHGAEAVAAIFDFDRTLSLFEGLIGGNHESIPENSGIQGYVNLLNEASPIAADGIPVLTTPAGLIDYLFGGPERVAWLHTLFQQIQTRGNPLIILTNNSTAIRNPQLFKDFFPGQQDYISVICGSPFGYHKPSALHANPAFTHLFSAPLPEGERFIILFSRDTEHAPLLHVDFVQSQREPLVLNVNGLYPLPPSNTRPRRRSIRKRDRKITRRKRKN